MFDLIGDLVFLEGEILFGEFSFEIFCFTGDDLSFFMGDDFETLNKCWFIESPTSKQLVSKTTIDIGLGEII